MSISAVIITYNAALHLEACLKSISEVVDDIVIIDAMSTDDTEEIAQAYDLTFVKKEWIGYGAAKNHGTSLAKHDWILSIDADEVIDPMLRLSISNLTMDSIETQYTFRRINFLGERPIRFSHLKPEYKSRIYNRRAYQWNDSPVHEALSPRPKEKILLKGCLNHYTSDSITELRQKYLHYARLNHTPNIFKRIISPSYHFLRCYISQLGFLEGALGWQLAKLRYVYTKAKYSS